MSSKRAFWSSALGAPSVLAAVGVGMGVGVGAWQELEGVLVLNIGSYMAGVDLWQNEEEHDDNFGPQLMHDRKLEVVGVCGAWHLGKLRVRPCCPCCG